MFTIQTLGLTEECEIGRLKVIKEEKVEEDYDREFVEYFYACEIKHANIRNQKGSVIALIQNHKVVDYNNKTKSNNYKATESWDNRKQKYGKTKVK